MLNAFESRFPRQATALRAWLGKLYLYDIERLALERCGERVMAGPFKGMRYVGKASCSALVPKLLGTYERELAPAVERIVAQPYDDVVDIGCAEGYYAVGMALRMPASRILAFDIDASALEGLRSLAAKNGVTDRITIGSECTSETLEALQGRRVAIICDIEGAELQLLDPAQTPALTGFDLLVEIHDGPASHVIRDALAQRFAATHDIDFIPHLPRSPADAAAAPWLGHARHRSLAVDEQRTFGIEWGFFRSRHGLHRSGQAAARRTDPAP